MIGKWSKTAVTSTATAWPSWHSGLWPKVRSVSFAGCCTRMVSASWKLLMKGTALSQAAVVVWTPFSDFLGFLHCCSEVTYCWFSLRKSELTLLTLYCNRALWQCVRMSRVSQQSIKHRIDTVNTEGVKQNISANKMNTELQHEIHELVSAFSTVQWLANIKKKYMADSFPNNNFFCKLWWPLARGPTSSRQLRLC